MSVDEVVGPAVELKVIDETTAKYRATGLPLQTMLGKYGLTIKDIEPVHLSAYKSDGDLGFNNMDKKLKTLENSLRADLIKQAEGAGCCLITDMHFVPIVQRYGDWNYTVAIQATGVGVVYTKMVKGDQA